MTTQERTYEQGAGQVKAAPPMEHAVSTVASALVVLAVALAFAGELGFLGWSVRAYVVSIIAGAGVVYVAGQCNDAIGRMAVIFVTAALLVLGTSYLPSPDLLYLWGLVVGLAVAAISLRAGTITSVLGSLIVILWSRNDADHGQSMRLVVAVLGIWGAYGIVYWLHTSAAGTAAWSWRQFEQAQELLEEARTGRAHLHEALDDLAHANRQLALANENLATMRRIAENAQHAKAIFVSKVSHEFRTPLNMIIGLTDLPVTHPEIYEAPLPPMLVEDLAIVRRNSLHLLSMINDVLDLSQVETGQLALYRKEVDLSALLQESVMVEPLLRKKGLSLTLEVEDDLAVYCDPTRIRQVVLNLVSNAARFTEQGGITVSAERQPATVEVAVSDTGPGIPTEDVERIFEPFYQSRSEGQGQAGTGLGLSISRQFVEQHGGRMWLESVVGKGSSFRFALPIDDAHRPQVRADRWISEQWPWIERSVRSGAPVTDTTPRLVVLDTSGDLVDIASRYVHGIEFVRVSSPSEAIQEVKRGGFLGVLVNTASANALWPTADAIARGMPYVPVLGCSFPPSRERAMAAGASQYLVKPIDRDVLSCALDGLAGPLRKVLVVDDDPDCLLLLSRMLKIWRGDLQVVAVESGQRALAALENEDFDAVLLDIIMPDMDGWQVLAHMQQQSLGQVPVIIVSAQDAREEPLASPLVMVSTGQGLSIGRVLRYVTELLRLTYAPLEDAASGPDREQ